MSSKSGAIQVVNLRMQEVMANYQCLPWRTSPPFALRTAGSTDMRKSTMSKTASLIIAIFCLPIGSTVIADECAREYVELPEMLQRHMMSNMRDHLSTINTILEYLSGEKLDEAAEIAESRLGMSSLELHNASRMAKYMPEGMRRAGTAMHKAASRFALKAQEGELLPAYRALSEITSACVACHAAYRIR